MVKKKQNEEEECFTLQTNKVKIIKTFDLRKIQHVETVEEKRKKVNKIVKTIDTLISITIIAPLVVGFWRGTWEILEIYWHLFPWAQSFVLAAVLHICLLLIRQFIQDFVDRDRVAIKKHFRYIVLRRIHAYFYALICVMQWRGVWHFFDFLTEDKHHKICLSAFILMSSVFCLGLLRSVRNTIAPPFVLVLDSSDASFNFPTRYRITMAEKTTLYVLDCIFSVLVVGTLVVFVWRGAWVLLDDFLFPESASLSAWCSLVIGYLAVGLAFLLQPVMRWVCDRLQGGLRLIAADIFLLFSLFGTVNVWRGIWTLLNLYFLPDNQEISCWITHWICLILLVLLGCSNSLLVRGVYIDAEEPAGKCVIFPCYYLRLIFQQERAKKIAKRLQLDILAKRKQDIDNNIADINHMVHEKQPNNHVV
ncbi:uncharacterized protein [Onthophagus taurus]|uniref:uncharacterized protein isoform X1 n=1 Tax=Onthophagus taurus TaxID=166361 RepID=UPI000C20E5B1|nr:uncharacterized protein LOC111427525 isoform X2 [Onthophagus taurus]